MIAPDVVLAGARFLTPDGVRDDVALRVAGGTISALDAGPAAPGEPVVDLAGAWVLPGFIDLHMHGGGGASVAASREAMEQAVAFHCAHGTTATLLSLVTAPVEELREQLGWAAQLAARGPTRRGTVLGSHLEGPFLSPDHCGAQNPEAMRAPDLAVLGELVDAAHGSLRAVTLAPELDGALELIAELRAQEIVVALGHSGATYEEARAGIRAGISHATHLFNATPALHHRAPGPVGALLAAGVSCELINDGRHLHPAIVGLVAGMVKRPVLVTDAIEAAGTGDRRFRLGGQAVEVRDGEARLVRDGSLAGSTLTMDDAVRRAVRECGLSLERASAAASAHPAGVLGLDGRIGSLASGHRADLVVLDDDLRVQAVMIAGEWADGSPMTPPRR